MFTPLARFLMLVHGMKELLGLAPRDVLYSALPMYHAAAGVIVLGAAMSQGLTMVSRRKFSATRFWQDCHQHGVTVSSLGSLVVRMCRLVLLHRFHNRFSQSRRRPLLWPSPG